MVSSASQALASADAGLVPFFEKNRQEPFAFVKNGVGAPLPDGDAMFSLSARETAINESGKVLFSAQAVKALNLSKVALRYKVAMRSFTPSKTRRFVRVSRAYKVGDIVVMSDRRRLYLIVGRGRAIEFTIAVGRHDKAWRGTYKVSMKREWPEWRPTASMREKDPSLKAVYAGGRRNPLGSRALYLGHSLYRIHGTNNPTSIGRSVTSGCFRLLNSDVEYLYDLVGVGTRVIVN